MPSIAYDFSAGRVDCYVYDELSLIDRLDPIIAPKKEKYKEKETKPLTGSNGVRAQGCVDACYCDWRRLHHPNL